MNTIARFNKNYDCLYSISISMLFVELYLDVSLEVLLDLNFFLLKYQKKIHWKIFGWLIYIRRYLTFHNWKKKTVREYKKIQKRQNDRKGWHSLAQFWEISKKVKTSVTGPNFFSLQVTEKLLILPLYGISVIFFTWSHIF